MSFTCPVCGRTTIDLPNGRVVLAETSLWLFLGAANLLRVRYGEP